MIHTLLPEYLEQMTANNVVQLMDNISRTSLQVFQKVGLISTQYASFIFRSQFFLFLIRS